MSKAHSQTLLKTVLNTRTIYTATLLCIQMSLNNQEIFNWKCSDKGITKISPQTFLEIYSIQHYCYLLNFVESTSENKSTKHLKLLPPGNSCVEQSIKQNYSYHFTSLMYLFCSMGSFFSK